MDFVYQAIEEQPFFTSYTLILSLNLVSKVELIQKRRQTEASLRDKIAGLKKNSNPLGYLTDKMPFVNTNDADPNEFHVLCETANYIGLQKLGTDQLWNYLVRRYDKLNSFGNLEQICAFVEGIKIRGKKLKKYTNLINISNELVDVGLEQIDFDRLTYLFYVQSLLQESQE